MRLIDADALTFESSQFDTYNDYSMVFDTIDLAPTIEAEPARQWISVKDRLPEVRHAVLGYAPFHKNIWAVTMHEDGCWYFWYPGTSKYDPDWYSPLTHWMPLPEAPQEEDNGQ